MMLPRAFYIIIALFPLLFSFTPPLQSRPLPTLQLSSTLSPDEPPSASKRREKKNKYASFSKTPEVDPLDALLAESAAKNAALESKSSKGKKAATPTPNTSPKPRNDFPDNSSINPSDPSTYGFVRLGYVSAAHGVHGGVRVVADTDFGDVRLERSGWRGLKAKGRRYPRDFYLTKGKRVKVNEYICMFEGVVGREGAEKIRGFELFIKDSLVEESTQTAPAVEGEWRVPDLVGLPAYRLTTAYGEQPQVIGTVAGLILAKDVNPNLPDGVGSDMLEISLVDRSRNGKEMIALVPLVEQLVPRIVTRDEKGGIGAGVWIDPPPGLLELAAEKEEKVIIRGLLAAGKDD